MAGGGAMFERALAGLVVVTAVSMNTAVAAPAASAQALEGSWGGDRLLLVIDAGGGRVQMDCASGSITGPIALAANGSFIATGTFLAHQAGPQRIDETATPATARYAGELIGSDALRLSILAPGAAAAQVFNLRRGATFKLIRCL